MGVKGDMKLRFLVFPAVSIAYHIHVHPGQLLALLMVQGMPRQPASSPPYPSPDTTPSCSLMPSLAPNRQRHPNGVN
jgi:hypothetical protein